MPGPDLRVWQRPRSWVVAVTVVACAAISLAVPSTGYGAARPPVVMVVFDAFPTVSLLNAKGRIDGAHYPTFSRLAADSTWFPYATTSVDETGRAFREIFTSRTSWRFAKPSYAANPNNLFTLLGGKYRIEDGEESTSFCPKRLCPNVRPQTAESIIDKLEAGRPERFAEWVGKINASKRPTFYFKHVLFPHPPWTYLPSGKTYFNGPSENAIPRAGFDSIPWLIQQKYQRHLLQVEFADRLIGLMLDKLEATGLYDRSLIIVTADHGESFGRPGEGRNVDKVKAGDIALKPLFVKLPGQRNGRIDRRPVRNLDIAPTVARVARVRPRWRVEGRAMFGPPARRIPRSSVLVGRSGQRIRMTAAVLRRYTAQSLRLKLNLFGRSAGAFGLGPSRGLHGTPAANWPALPASALRATIDYPDRYRGVNLDSPSPPVKVTGRLTGPGSTNPLDIAIAVNGTIEATASAFAPTQGASRIFSALVPETSLRAGANTVQLFAIEGSAGAPSLRPLGGT